MGVQHPLNLIMPIKGNNRKELKENVEQLQAVTKYMVTGNALHRIGTVHFGRFMFLNLNRDDPKSLPTHYGLLTTYDGTFDDYILDFVHDTSVGRLFNVILSHIEYDEKRFGPVIPVQKYPLEFVEFIKAHDEPTANWYSAYQNLSVRDVWNAYHWREHALDFMTALQEFRDFTKRTPLWRLMKFEQEERFWRAATRFMEETARPLDQPTDGGQNNRPTLDELELAFEERERQLKVLAVKIPAIETVGRLELAARIEFTNPKFDDIQGNTIRGYGFPFTKYVFVKFHDETDLDTSKAKTAAQWGKSWLKSFVRDVRSSVDWGLSKPKSAINVAFTYEGLKELLGDDHEALDQFPEEFRLGAGGRAKWVGDVGKNDPENWQETLKPEKVKSDDKEGYQDAIHCLVTIHAASKDELKGVCQVIEANGKHPGIKILDSIDGASLPKDKEHFGFVDGISQPVIQGVNNVAFRGNGTPMDNNKWNPLPLGEFIHGYQGNNGGVISGPAAEFEMVEIDSEKEDRMRPLLSKNGTYMVLRKLQQDVPAFRQFLKDVAKQLHGTDDKQTQELIAAKLMGRYRDGKPLIDIGADDATHKNLRNDFRYADDPIGEQCPRGSHIRRMNPRDDFDERLNQLDKLAAADQQAMPPVPISAFHRILRRGKPYGPELPANASEDGKERGLVFVAINSDISRQFEFLQNLWVNGGDDLGLDPGSMDPIVGCPATNSTDQGKDDANGRNRIVIFPKRTPPIPQFVTVKLGVYLFVPSMTALYNFAGLKYHRLTEASTTTEAATAEMSVEGLDADS